MSTWFHKEGVSEGQVSEGTHTHGGLPDAGGHVSNCVQNVHNGKYGGRGISYLWLDCGGLYECV